MTLSSHKFDYDYYTYSLESNTIENLYKVCFKDSIRYKRLAGYFSSSIYKLFQNEILEFVQNGGNIRLICSQDLSENDIESLKNGYEQRRKLIENNITEDIDRLLENSSLSEQVDFVATLIKFRKLEIKIAFSTKGNVIFHEKTGYFIDLENNIIAFNGSSNESSRGILGDGNSETVHVFKSWEDSDKPRVANIVKRVDKIWNNKAYGLETIDFPKVPIDKLRQRAKNSLDAEVFPGIKKTKNSNNFIKRKSKIDMLLDYQKESITNWERDNCRGILKHATGSGKTISAIFAIQKHIRDGKPCLILVPSKLLLQQWYSELNNELKDKCSILKCGGGFTNWKKNKKLFYHLQSTPNKVGSIVVAIMKTAASKDFQKQLSNFNDTLFVVDEVHAVGSSDNLNILLFDFNKRLGLSATPERYNDTIGTKKIMDFFERLIKPEVTIEDSIKMGRLVEYIYKPEVIYFNEDEEEEWIDFTNKIVTCIRNNNIKNDNDLLNNKHLELLLIQRSKIAKKAVNKVKGAINIIKNNYDHKSFWLIYCEDQDQLNNMEKHVKEINCPYYIYTSSMDEKSAFNQLNAFQKNGGILLSIRCLDEGIDIPQISHAIIIASSQNPRQFIQRRGRVLRTFKGKLNATIYDFFTVPKSPMSKFNGLLKSELKRGLEFSNTAKNKYECHSTINRLLISMNIDPNDLLEDIEEKEDE